MDVPGVVGVPLMIPVIGSMPRPAGRAPNRNHANGIVPPLVAIGREYGAVAVPPGNEVVVMDSVGAIAIERAFESEAPAWSATLIVKSAVPAVDGVPEIAPVAGSRASPAGSAPAVRDHVSG